MATVDVLRVELPPFAILSNGIEQGRNFQVSPTEINDTLDPLMPASGLAHVVCSGPQGSSVHVVDVGSS